MNRLRNERGFTLVEILVSTAILTVIVGLLCQAINQTNKVGQLSRADSERVDKVALTFDMLRRDLSGALLPALTTSQNSLHFVVNPDTSTGITDALQHPHSAFWQAPVASDLSKGDIATVGYFIRQDASATPPRSTLCRLQVDASDPAYLVGSTPAWLDEETVLNTKALAAAPEYQGLLIEGALALYIRAIDEDIDKSDKYSYQWSSLTAPVAPKKYRLPKALEIALVVVDERTLQKMATLPVPTASADAANMDDEIENFLRSLPQQTRQGSRVFRSIIPLANFRQ